MQFFCLASLVFHEIRAITIASPPRRPAIVGCTNPWFQAAASWPKLATTFGNSNDP
jgi:hypothetical protein